MLPQGLAELIVLVVLFIGVSPYTALPTSTKNLR